MDYETISNLFSNFNVNNDDNDNNDVFDVNIEYSDKDLHDNIMNGNLDYIIKYLNDGGNPNRIILDQFSLLLTAVYFNKKSIVNLLIKHNVDLEFEQIFQYILK